jgi:hypothetical protein
MKIKTFLPVIGAILGFILLSLPFLAIGSFSDEYEQAVSGWFLLNGLLPYRDFFSHHAPLPLFVGLLGFTVPGADPILVLRILMLILEIGVWIFLFSVTRKAFRPVLFLIMFFSAISIPTFNLQMALADTFVYYGLLVMIVLLAHRWHYGSPSTISLSWTYAVIAFVCFWSSIASALPLIVLGLIILFAGRKQWRSLMAPLVFGLAGLIIFPLIYLCLKSFPDFWWSVFKYNTSFYFPLHLAQNSLDLKYGPLFQVVWQFLTLFLQSLSAFFAKSLILVQSLWGAHQLVLPIRPEALSTYLAIVWREYLRFFESIQSLIFLGAGSAFLSLIASKKIVPAALFMLLGVSLFFRSNEIFHLSPLFLLIVLAASFSFVVSWKSKSRWGIILPGIFLMLLAYNLIPPYVSRLGEKPSYITDDLYHLSAVAKTNSLPTDKMMVVGGNMVYYLLAQRLPACKYHYYLPWLEGTPPIKKEFEGCLNSSRTRLVLAPDKVLAKDVQPLLEQNYLALPTDGNVFVRRN